MRAVCSQNIIVFICNQFTITDVKMQYQPKLLIFLLKYLFLIIELKTKLMRRTQ